MSELKELFQQIPFKGNGEKEERPAGIPSLSQEMLRKLLGFIDGTTLDVKDTEEKVATLCRRVNALPEEYPEAGQVAGVCVYPVFVPVVNDVLSAPGVRIVSVSAGFPAAQTFMEVKIRETEMALKAGAEEIDIVIAVGKVLRGQWEDAYREIKMIREVIGGRGHLKVILESGVLDDAEKIHRAAVTAMAAGADFIKTSTGKVSPAARPGDVRVMARAVRRYHEVTGRQVGIKPAGGISTPGDALLYTGIIEEELGEKWLVPGLFRIGASRLANNLLTAMPAYNGKEKAAYF